MDRQELALAECFDQLMDKAEGADKQEIESIASKSATDFRNTGQMSIYKPNLKAPTPRKTNNN